MAAVFADESRVSQAIAPHSRSVSIAAVNGPESTVISGDVEAVREVLAEFGRPGSGVSRSRSPTPSTPR